MPLERGHIENYLKRDTHPRDKAELYNMLKERIEELCENCQRDRIRCVLNPMCYHRFLLKLRILNGLKIEDQPKFCYSVHKNIILRDFLNKTVVYKPYDSYLYMVDFFDVFFHGDYRKLNKFISKRQYKDVKKIFDDRIYNRNENFNYILTEGENYLIFKYGDKIHVLFIRENYAICNANREGIYDLEILLGLCRLFSKIYFPEVRISQQSDWIEILTIIPQDILIELGNSPKNDNEKNSKRSEYLWGKFSEDLDELSQFCKEINLYFNEKGDLSIKLNISLKTGNPEPNKQSNPIRYRDMQSIFDIITRLYNDFYIIWI